MLHGGGNGSRVASLVLLPSLCGFELGWAMDSFGRGLFLMDLSALMSWGLVWLSMGLRRFLRSDLRIVGCGVVLFRCCCGLLENWIVLESYTC